MHVNGDSKYGMMMTNGAMTNVVCGMHVVKLFWERMYIRVIETHGIVPVCMQYVMFISYDCLWVLVFRKGIDAGIGLSLSFCIVPSLCLGWYGVVIVWQLFVLKIF